jgi:hypothetical protein
MTSRNTIDLLILLKTHIIKKNDYRRNVNGFTHEKYGQYREFEKVAIKLYK